MYLKTDRLILRNWQTKDYNDLYEFASDDEVTKFLTFKTYKTKQEAIDRINTFLETQNDNDNIGDFAIELKSENKVIGSLHISFKDVAGGTVSLGWLLNKNYQGKGYMTEIVNAILKYLKKNNIAKRIVAICDVENIKSANVMKRVGMTFEGISRKARDNNLHTRHDVANYSILYEEIKD